MPLLHRDPALRVGMAGRAIKPTHWESTVRKQVAPLLRLASANGITPLRRVATDVQRDPATVIRQLELLVDVPCRLTGL